jgi:histidinol-phosphate/aromatic aminotransferase/cobyric acid decarboxylase-like protein
LCSLYAWSSGADPDEFHAGRGIAELLMAMARCVDPSTVAIPLPATSDLLRAFPVSGFGGPRDGSPTIELLDAAMDAARVVIVSNPHNPTGGRLTADDLSRLAAAHPSRLLVVDESLVDFTVHPARNSLIGCDADNVVVLRSPSTFYGIASVRTGVAWCRDGRRLERLIGPQETWSLSGIDVSIAEAAVRSRAWADEVRAELRADNAWLAEALRAVPGVRLAVNDNVHFQFASVPHSSSFANRLSQYGVGVRVLGAGHGLGGDALRVVAPREHERDAVSRALASVGARALDRC